MNKNFTKILFLVLVAGFFMPVFCLATSYTRSPTGATITNPVSFDMSFDDFNIDTGCNSEYGQNYWGVQVWRYWFESPEWFVSEFVPSSTLSNVFSIILPLGSYIKVSFSCSVDGINQNIDGTQLEYNDGPPIFEILSPSTSIITISSISGILEYATRLFTDLQLLVWLAIGLPVGFWIINKAIILVVKRTKK
jgi:hypothetical protein